MATATAPTNPAADSAAANNEPLPGSYQESLAKPASEVLSLFVTRVLDKRLAKKPLSKWPTEVLEFEFARALDAIAKFDDPEKWPLTTGEHIAARREIAFFGGRMVSDVDGPADIERNDVALDARLLARALDVRRKVNAPPKPRSNQGPSAPAQAEQLAMELPAPAADVPAGTTEEEIHLSLDEIEPDVTQVRSRENVDEGLAPSIRVQGVLQAITVRLNPDPSKVAKGIKYLIVDGERRYVGARAAGRRTIPAKITTEAEHRVTRAIRQATSNTGKPLTPIEEARAWSEIIQESHWTAAQLAEVLGVPKSTVSDRLVLAKAPAPFLPFFEKGAFSTAAAPLVRKLADVPLPILKRAAENLANDYDVKVALRDGRAIPLDEVEGLIDDVVIDDEIAPLLLSAREAAEFRGETFTLGKDVHAADLKALTTFRKDAAQKEAARLKEANKTKGGTVSASTVEPAAPVKREPERWQLEQRKRAKEAKRKAALRRQYYAAVVAKLPMDLNVTWWRNVVRWLTEEMQGDTLRVACAALEVPAPKSTYGRGYALPVRKFAESLNVGELAQLVLKLLLANDLAVPTYSSRGPERISAAAALLGVNLKTIKLQEEAKPAKQSAEERKVAAKHRREKVNKAARAAALKRIDAKDKKAKVKKGKAKRISPVQDFMKPFEIDEVLAEVVGKGPLPRTEITKKLWQYIKKHDLQDKKERRMINADEKLRLVFGGKKRVSMFEMTKLITKHAKQVKK